MTKIEMIFVVAACCVPIVALLFIMPKPKKKDESIKIDKPTEPFVIEKPIDTEPRVVEKEEVSKEKDNEHDEFEHFLRNRSIPTMRRNVDPFEFDKEFALPKRRIKEEPKNIADQFDDLSPEMKAIVIAGVFQRRDD